MRWRNIFLYVFLSVIVALFYYVNNYDSSLEVHFTTLIGMITYLTLIIFDKINEVKK